MIALIRVLFVLETVPPSIMNNGAEAVDVLESFLLEVCPPGVDSEPIHEVGVPGIVSNPPDTNERQILLTPTSDSHLSE